MAYYRIALNDLIPEYFPLQGWRRVLHAIGFPIPRASVVQIAPGNVLIVNPGSVLRICAKLDRLGHRYDFDRSHLVAVPKEQP